ncbi:MAG TPA: hypothetical protein VI979_03100 [archaeon]|nr:hypothetical protein [archaeon]
MMEIEYGKGHISISRELSSLDKFVIDFINALDAASIKYVIVSGYVSILFVRTRGTEDVDIFIEKPESPSFYALCEKNPRFWIINTASEKEAYDMLIEGYGIRFAEKGKAIPNMEVKIGEMPLERISAAINGFKLFISPIEIQIAYKFYLGSEKDIEDAVYLYELFKERLDRGALLQKCKELNVMKWLNKYAGQGKKL